MRRDPLLWSTLVLAACVAGGALECSHRSATAAEVHGAELYARMCSVCHGPSGEGYKADQAPAIAHPDFLASATDSFLHDAIVQGRAGTTMSAWGVENGGPLVRTDADAVVVFLRTWEKGPRAKLDERPLSGDIARGAEAYGRTCADCHGARGTTGPAIHIGDSGFLAAASDGFLRHAILRGRAGTPMHAFADALGAANADDIVALLRSWQTRSQRVVHGPAARPPPLPLGPVPLNPKGPEPLGFRVHPGTTPADIVKAQLDRQARMAILDARAPSDYAREHIAGSVSVPFYDPDPYVSALPKDAWLVCYCACPHAESGQLAQKLLAKGFTKVTVLDEGLGVWKARKYETRVGLEP
jgi:cytochrome c oxidase cbb3-type subunit 3/ubiquinol-cytochrome c reductase cytochrome c subunit